MKDYLHGKLLWNNFNCQSFREYHDLYLKSDVYLFTDFFEKFRTMCIDSYGLDGALYYTAQGMFNHSSLDYYYSYIIRLYLIYLFTHLFRHSLGR